MKINIFDHNKMISTVMKRDFTREIPERKYYRVDRKFDFDFFSSELSRQLDLTFCSFFVHLTIVLFF